MKGPNQNPTTPGMWAPPNQGGQTPHGGPNQGGQPSPSGNNAALWSAATAEATPHPPGTQPGMPPRPGSGSGPAYLTDEHGILRPGVQLGKYQIVRPLGSGGMGSVYEAVHTGIGKPVALKTMSAALANDARAEQRFLREAAAASRLEHPHVVDVTDFGSDNGIIYIVMELMRGEDLAALVQRAPAGLDVTFVADVMLPVCAGVFAAHEKGVIHRDLKPQNVFLARTALGEVVPKVLDFGISKLMDEQANSALTNSGSVMGTTHYLSPEQVTGMPIDGRSDEFALGVILYECVTGRRPHEGETIFTIMRAISDGRFTRPMAVRQDLPPQFEAVILKALANRPDDRFPTVHALGCALLSFASPKGRVMWGEYFDRGGGGIASAARAATGFAPTAWPATMAVPGMMPGQLGAPAGDTRSGVRPVSVMGSNELLQRRGSTTRKAALLVLGLGAAGAIWLSMGDRKGLEEVKQGVQTMKEGLSAGSGPAQGPAPTPASRSAGRAVEPPTTTPPPPVTPPVAKPNPAVAEMVEMPVAPAKAGAATGAGTATTATSAPSTEPRPGAIDTGTTGKKTLPPRTKPGLATKGPLLPTFKTVRAAAKPTPVTPRRTASPSPSPQLDIPLPPKKPEPEPPRNNRLINPGTSPILD